MPGIKNLRIQNRSLQIIWLWRFVSDEQSLWKRVIKAKYDMEGVWITKEVSSTYGVGLWKTISNLWFKSSLKTSFKVGNGIKIAFWEDD